MFIKILPLKYPSITHKPTIAHLLSILETKGETKGWIITNYLNFYINKIGKADFWGKDNLFDNCPWIFQNSIPRELLRSCNIDIIDFCKCNLQLNYYIYIVINEKHIKAYDSKHDLEHNMLIYGLDDKQRLIYIADFFRNGKYAFTTCSYDELVKGFNDPFVDSTSYYETIRTIKLKEISFVLEPQIIKKSIDDYITSTNLFCKYNKIPYEESLEVTENEQYTYFTNNYLKNNYYFGFEFYEQLYFLFKDQKYKDIRTFHLIYDKMLLMDIRLEYLKAHNIVDNYNKLTSLSKNNVSLSLVLRNMVIKSIVNESDNLNNRILNNLKLLSDSDYHYCNILLNSMRY